MSQSQRIVSIISQASTGTINSAALEINKPTIACSNFSFQTTFTGSPSGSLYLQVSNDMTSPVNWTTLTDYVQNISGSQSEPIITYGRQLGFGYVRQKWVGNASSAGTISACGVANP